MNSTPLHDVDTALAYPEPPASPLWHRHGAKALLRMPAPGADAQTGSSWSPNATAQ
ncbi:hypothetical protein ACFWHQ_31845 [Streptomyces sp. NPDC060334]|uniref:hypothetical protein n=1 Tax=Streptomyces sp. NPDC060334 TaxID=3347099 RepID=UPI00364A0DEC